MEMFHYLFCGEIPFVEQAGLYLFHQPVGNLHGVPHCCDQFFVFRRFAGNHVVAACRVRLEIFSHWHTAALSIQPEPSAGKNRRSNVCMRLFILIL